MANEPKKLNDDRIRLSKIVREKKQQIENLNTKLSGLETLFDEKKSLEVELTKLRKEKEKISALISDNSNLESAYTAKKVELETLINQISSTQLEFSEVAESLTVIETKRNEISSDLDLIKKQVSSSSKTLSTLKEEKNSLEALMVELRDKYGLYSQEMAEMSKDSITQLTTYALSAMVSLMVTITLMIILTTILVGDHPYKNELSQFYPNDPYLKFFSILTIRLSISVVFIFLILIFLNLTKSFVSQYVKSRNRLTALRIADFLIGKVNIKIDGEQSEDDILQTKKEILKEQTDLLKEHIPKIMDMANSSFDKPEKSEINIDKASKLKELFKP